MKVSSEPKKKVHLYKAKVNNLMKRVKNSDNLQRIISSALEDANKEKGKLQAQTDELTAEVNNL